MAELHGCHIPEELYYWPEKHVWARPEPDGSVTIGITDVAQHLARAIINVTPKGLGKKVQRGKSAGTLESGKWVGPVTAPVSGQIVALNDAMLASPNLLNEDPYNDGWFARVQVADWESDRAELVTGAEGVEVYRKFLESTGISCSEA
ncbi:MAG TPA: glycine cleavage system protein H [Chloroflexi bacterium]|nr:glycine cleavage system protein H [Chloroflexota bacterium]